MIFMKCVRPLFSLSVLTITCSLGRLRQELTRLITKQAEKVRDPAQNAIYLSTTYEAILQTFSVRLLFCAHALSLTFHRYCTDGSTTEYTSKSSDGDCILERTRGRGSSTNRVFSGMNAEYSVNSDDIVPILRAIIIKICQVTRNARTLNQYGGSANDVSRFRPSLSVLDASFEDWRNGALRVVPPLDCLPIPSLFKTSRTSLGGARPRLLLIREIAKGSG